MGKRSFVGWNASQRLLVRNYNKAVHHIWTASWATPAGAKPTTEVLEAAKQALYAGFRPDMLCSSARSTKRGVEDLVCA